MKILITGGKGSLGSTLSEVFPQHGFQVSSIDALDADLCDLGQLRHCVSAAQPDVIVHTAACTDVEACQQTPDHAYDVNVFGTHNLLRVARGVGARVVYISSDYVFDGRRGHYRECDQPSPINFYGRTKLLGESLAQGMGEESLIVRASTFYGGGSPASRGFAHRVLEALSEDKNVYAAVDQIACPTLLSDFAEGLAWLIRVKASGIWHIAGPQAIARYIFARRIAEAFAFNSARIIPVRLDELGVPHRPRDVSLGTIRADTFNCSSVCEGLEKWRQSYAPSGLSR